MKTVKPSPLRWASAAAVAFTALRGLPAADIHVPMNHATIQAAVDAASDGDTIHIAPGVYVEQTWINGKNLTLVGRPGTILRAFAGMAPGIPGIVQEKPIIFIGDSPAVTLKDLCFEGDQLGGQNTYAMLGVVFSASGGSVENCRFTGFREKTPGSVGGAAILFWNGNDGATRYQANVSGSTIEDCYSGIFIYGAKDVISYDVTVIDNRITGVGPTTAWDFLQGIHTDDGTTGLVARNTVSGFVHDGPVGPGLHPIPFGILRASRSDRPLPPMTFEDNVLRDNQVHLALFESDDCIVRNNTFEETVPLIEDADPGIVESAVGLWFSGAGVQVIGNRFTGNQTPDPEQGIRLAGNDIVGTATDAMLTDNRFCEVARQLVPEPGATFTETGTLTCPFPPPELQLDHAVLLSWPSFYDDWTPECSSDMESWTPVEGPRLIRDGMFLVPAPADGPHKFFRLVGP